LLWINQFAVAPAAGGGTRHFEIGRELVRLGWDVTIVASDLNLQTRSFDKRTGADDRTPILEEIDGVRFCWVWTAPYRVNNWRRAWNWVSFARSVAKLSRHLPASARSPDLVIGSSPQLLAAHASFKLSKRVGAPFVFEVRDLWPESLIAAGGKRGIAYRVFDTIARALYRSADGIVVLAKGSADYLIRERGVDPERIRFVPNGVDVDAFSVPARPKRPSTTFVYTGAHGPANGLDVVLDAAQLLSHRSDIRILLVGSGPDKERLRANAEARALGSVEFRDPVPKQQIPALLAEADAGLMILRPSKLFEYGVSPNKLFDYMAAGLPIVCNVPGEVADMVAEADAGVQVAPGDAAELARAIEEIADAGVERRALMGIRAREWVSQENTRPVLATRLGSYLMAFLPEDRALRSTRNSSHSYETIG